MSAENSKSVLDTLLAKDLWKVIAVGAASFTTVCGLGFTAGLKYEESQANLKQAELNVVLGMVQAKLETVQGKVQGLSEVNGKLSQNYNQLLDILNSRNAQIEQLSAHVRSTDNCAFIHQQIRSMEQEIKFGGVGVVFGGTSELEEQYRVRRVSLEQRLAGYQALLGPGSCK